MIFPQKKISDRIFLRYIQRMLKSGVLGDSGFRLSEDGVTQGQCLQSGSSQYIRALFVG